MAQRSKARRGRPVRAWVLIRFHEAVGSSHRKLSRVEVAPGWPGGASLMRADRVKPLQRGKVPLRRYHTFAEVHAANRAALNAVLDYIEAHFSHTDVYEF